MNKEKLKDVGVAVLIVLILIAAGMAFIFILNPQPQSSAFEKWVSGNAVVESNLTSNQTLQQNESLLLTAQVVGYDSAYDLNITAVSGHQAHMITSFYLNVTGYSNSSVFVYLGPNLLYSNTSWSWNLITPLLKAGAANGTQILTVKLSSSNGASRTLLFYFTFVTPVQYINYAYQKVNHKTPSFIPLNDLYGVAEFFGISGILSVGAAIGRQKASSKGWQLRKMPKKKDPQAKKSKWREMLGL